MLDKHSPKIEPFCENCCHKSWCAEEGERSSSTFPPGNCARWQCLSPRRSFYVTMVDHLPAYRAQPANKRNLLPFLLLLLETCSHPARATCRPCVAPRRLLQAALVELLELSHRIQPAKPSTMDVVAGLAEKPLFTEFKATQEALAAAVNGPGGARCMRRAGQRGETGRHRNFVARAKS